MLNQNNKKRGLLGALLGTPAKPEMAMSKDGIATLLGTSPEALDAFESAYQTQVLAAEPDGDNFFAINAKQAAAMNASADAGDAAQALRELNDRIIAELLAQTHTMVYDGRELYVKNPGAALAADNRPVTLEDILAIPEHVRPQLSGSLMKKDVPGDTAGTLLWSYKQWLETKDPKKKQLFYNQFRQGLDILDLDGLTYEILSMNQNSMGNWLPPLVNGVKTHEFFKIPKTTIIKVPMTMLQLSRTDYSTLTSGTMDIVDRFCFQAFNLDENKDYFIKTGTYSSKFDFRNAKVTGAKEVHELGEYLLFIQFQAQMMASPLSTPSIYGVSTTNEWVVREFIEDVEGNPTIYKGLPLRTEYRVFVDFDDDKVIGMNPYWDPEVMKQRFGHSSDSESPHQIHDYVIYKAHEEKLMDKYRRNEQLIRGQVSEMLPDIDLPGQWSIDIMQNGDDFYIIDMALAANSALSFCVPNGVLKQPDENWLPKLPK